MSTDPAPIPATVRICANATLTNLHAGPVTHISVIPAADSPARAHHDGANLETHADGTVRVSVPAYGVDRTFTPACGDGDFFWLPEKVILPDIVNEPVDAQILRDPTAAHQHVVTARFRRPHMADVIAQSALAPGSAELHSIAWSSDGISVHLIRDDLIETITPDADGWYHLDLGWCLASLPTPHPNAVILAPLVHLVVDLFNTVKGLDNGDGYSDDAEIVTALMRFFHDVGFDPDAPADNQTAFTLSRSGPALVADYFTPQDIEDLISAAATAVVDNALTCDKLTHHQLTLARRAYPLVAARNN